MASNSKMEIEKFNGKSFELWKLKMEDLLVERDQWIAVDPGMAPTGTSADDWKKMDRKAKSTIRLCLSDSVLLNVSEEATTKDLWEKLGKLYQSKSLVNKLFLRKKLYNLRMRDGDSVAEHLNAFNTVVSQLVSVDIKISDEDKCISLLCSLPDSWDSLVVAIGSNTTALNFEEVVSSLLSEEMRRKNMEGHNTDALFSRGRSQERNRSNFSSGRSKSKGRSKSPGNFGRICWRCGNFFWADIFSPVSGRHISGTTYFRDHMILGGFRHMAFANGFLFPVKELGFWTNLGHWVRVLDAAGSYMYIVL
jgi:hypothetical protein